MRRLQYFILFFILPSSLLAQYTRTSPSGFEHLGPLHSNPAVVMAAKQQQQNKRSTKKTTIFPASLPFLDDFSKPGPYPDTNWWIDKKVFVNYGLPVCPHTLGVATFDGLDSIGKPYYPSNGPYTSVPSDTLTSKPIAWGGANLGDSVYLSFYYQAGSYFGSDLYGRPSLEYYPKKTDSLLLQFRAMGDTIWTTIWFHEGYQPTPDTDSTFRLVMIPFDTGTYMVNGTPYQFFSSISQLNSYMVDGFQFRFVAYSCGSGDVDHWSIDEVYMNKFRTYTDTMQYDLAFTYEAPPLLTNYSAEPWEQYDSTDLLRPPDSMHLFIRNNNNSYLKNLNNIVNYSTAYTINTPTTTTYSGGAFNLYPFIDTGYDAYAPHAFPPLVTKYFPPSLSGPTTFTITHTMAVTGDFDMWNDTLRYNQVFDNYYAYDDGGPECAYSINGYPGVPTYLADQFTLNKPDTIIGLGIYFDYVFINTETYSFIIDIWNDNGGQPGSIIYSDTIHNNISNPTFNFNGNDLFTVYFLQDSVPMPAGKFYIGWEQTTGDSINVGFDWNSNHSSELFYSVDLQATWYTSNFNGTAMIRPIVGSPTTYLAVNNIEKPNDLISIYPNPAQNEVHLDKDLDNATIRITGMDGRTLYEKEHFSGNTINTSELPNGFYIIQVTTAEQQTDFKKLVISR